MTYIQRSSTSNDKHNATHCNTPLQHIATHHYTSKTYVHCLFARFQELIQLILQYKYKESCPEDQILLNPSLRIGLCGTCFNSQHHGVVDFHQINMIRRKFLYQVGTSLHRANWRGRPLNICVRFIGFGGRERVKGRECVRKKERERE